MIKKIGIFMMVYSMSFAFSSLLISLETQSHPKLDCQKMALAYVKAFEDLDYRSLVQLRGMEYTEEDDAQFKKQFENPIPAPAKSLSLGLKGILDSNEAEVEIGFRWPDNKLEIAYVSFR